MKLSDNEFEALVAQALDNLPQERISGLDNLAITYEDEPSSEQRQKLQLRGSQTLFGLYEGIPLTKRAAASSLFSGTPMILPDKITIFKKPILATCSNIEEAREQVKHTLWHEIAHYYGLNHDQISNRE